MGLNSSSIIYFINRVVVYSWLDLDNSKLFAMPESLAIALPFILKRALTMLHMWYPVKIAASLICTFSHMEKLEKLVTFEIHSKY